MSDPELWRDVPGMGTGKEDEGGEQGAVLIHQELAVQTKASAEAVFSGFRIPPRPALMARYPAAGQD